jgi:hypothetical protein
MKPNKMQGEKSKLPAVREDSKKNSLGSLARQAFGVET